MIRKIIEINTEKCNGCGACAAACHEGAIGMIDEKATLLRDDYCDGLGDCLPHYPTGAITFVERVAAAYDDAAVQAKKALAHAAPLPCGCPGSHAKAIVREHENTPSAQSTAQTAASALQQWPVQIKLVPANAAYFENASLLIAADCTAYAYNGFHDRFIKNHIALIGCPKLDEGDYAEKLTAILRDNNIKNVSVVRMEVPCCGGIVNAVKTALQACGKMIPWQVVTISTDGKVIE